MIDRVIEKSNCTGRLLVVADQFEELFTIVLEPCRYSPNVFPNVFSSGTVRQINDGLTDK